MVEEQIVSLGDDEVRRRQHDQRCREGLFQRAVEAWDVHRVVDLPLHPLEQMCVAGRVEGVRRALAGPCADPVELGVGQVEAVHRNVRDPVGAFSRPDAATSRSTRVDLPAPGPPAMPRIARDA